MPDKQELSGRELDAAIAERVMGHVWDESRCRACGWPIGSFEDGGCTIESCSMRPYPVRRADTPSDYSSSIGAAMEVVEKMRQSGWHVEISDDCERMDTAWFVEFTRSTDTHLHTGDAGAETLPETICRAALEAIETNATRSSRAVKG